VYAVACDIDLHFLSHRVEIILVVLLLKIEGEMGKLALAAIVSSWVVPITIRVNHAVPEPYMVRTHLLTS